jgi:hypothetical protein
MRLIFLEAALTLVLVLLLHVVVNAAADEKLNPHADKGECTICHVAASDKLNGWFVLGSTKREMRADLNQLCQRCHKLLANHAGGFAGDGSGHATGKKTAVNHLNLPLANDGTITCATTCHNIHVASDDSHQLQKRLRLPVNSLCVSCHDK